MHAISCILDLVLNYFVFGFSKHCRLMLSETRGNIIRLKQKRKKERKIGKWKLFLAHIPNIDLEYSKIILQFSCLNYGLFVFL